MAFMDKMLETQGLVEKASKIPYGYDQAGTDVKGMGLSRPPQSDDFLYAYLASSWVHICVREKAQNAAAPPLRTFVYDGRDTAEIEVPVLKNPNPHVTWQELMEYSSSDLDLTGNAYWEKVFDDDGNMKEIYRLPPNRMTIVPDPVDKIKGYLFRVSGKKKVAFKPHEVMHVKYYHPLDQYYGLSPLMAGLTAVKTQIFGSKWNMRLLQKSAVPQGYISSTDDSVGLDPDSRIRLVKEWEDLVGGVENSHNLVVMPPGLQFEKSEMSPTELGFLDGMEMMRNEILALYGVPPVIVGIDISSYATASEQKVTFWQETMKPYLSKWAGRIDHDIMGEGRFVAYDLSEVSVFQQLRWQMVTEFNTAIMGGLMSHNQALAELNLPLREDGDTVWMPMNLVEVGEAKRPVLRKSLNRAVVGKDFAAGQLPSFLARAVRDPKLREEREWAEVQKRLTDFVLKVEARLIEDGYPKAMVA